MSSITVRFKREDKSVAVPEYKTLGSAGCDLCASRDAFVPSGGTCLVPTGVFLEVPEGYECQVRPRSGLANNHGVTVLNSPGTVDSDFRGEMMVLLLNTGRNGYRVTRGDRIAQLVFAPVTRATFAEADELSETARGAGGWGPTGR